MTWQPTATLSTLRLRAELLAGVRAFFAARGVIEVETPLLSRSAVTDPAIEYLTTEAQSLHGGPLYLHSSPEYAMKRLLAAGSGDIFQICRVFRDAELGRWHQPEFTLLEWYRVGWDEAALMDEVESLLHGLLRSHRTLGSSVRLSYAQGFRDTLGVDPRDALDDIVGALTARGIGVPEGLDRRGTLDLALSAALAPTLKRDGITFIYDFPADQAALARIKPQTPPVAARFEAFFGSIELANGFAELADAQEQRSRFEAELEERRRTRRRLPPLDEELLAALAHGLPDCAGVAVGFDRVVALAAGVSRISEAMSFAFER
jgi:lysyl-tRNA synthetase class 2